MEGQSGLSGLSVISRVSAIQGCPLSGVPLYEQNLSKVREERNPDNITSLPHAARGGALMLGSYDRDVASYVQSLKIAVGIVNHSTVVAAAKGIIVCLTRILQLLRSMGVQLTFLGRIISLSQRLCKT